MSLASQCYTTVPVLTSLHACIPATQVSPVCLCLYDQLLLMSAPSSIISISLYVYSPVQSFILSYYMPALYANNSMSSFMP
jgi:hypothetical protein